MRDFHQASDTYIQLRCEVCRLDGVVRDEPEALREWNEEHNHEGEEQ